ncbi:co-chaperone GroES [candidate division KSB1 bacterium]|nr:co-chaperone GroES [candidate division KSB1 bacterium]
MTIKPLADRVVIKPLDQEEKKVGGIIIPDTAMVAVGPGKISDSGQKMAMEVKKGDKVLYGKYSGTEVSVDGKDYLIMRESDILAVL